MKTRIEWKVGSDPKWYDNALGFDTLGEAQEYARDLYVQISSDEEGVVAFERYFDTERIAAPEGEE